MMASRGCSILGSGTSSQRMSLGLCQHRAFIVLLRSLVLTMPARGLDGRAVSVGCSRGPLARRVCSVNAETIRLFRLGEVWGEGAPVAPRAGCSVAPPCGRGNAWHECELGRKRLSRQRE